MVIHLPLSVKVVLNHGRYYQNQDLGAPFPPQLIIYPSTRLVYLAHWNPREKGRRLDNVTSWCCLWRSALWLNSVHSGKKL